MRSIDKTNFVEALQAASRDFHRNYFAMYSSVLGGVVTDPALMQVPADDHAVHRGDGIFETFKCVNGSIYNMAAHLDRLQESAERLSLVPPCSLAQIGDVAVETVRAGGQPNCLVRVVVSRGPGSFGVDPYDCPETQLYIVACDLHTPFMEEHPEGARVITSTIPVKHPLLATTKTCNYLPNMFMRKEAVDAGVDFVMAFDDGGFLAEGSTENIGIVTEDKRLLFPERRCVLSGTTMLRVIELAQTLVDGEQLTEVASVDISGKDVVSAAEILITGTTRNVVAATELDGNPVGDGRPGPLYAKLAELLLNDIADNEARNTEVFTA
jgi:branched-subunit amino acid aminotransferase/4-amino-4-deoxychorismate lyase